jgi:hypothetical protein
MQTSLDIPNKPGIPGTSEDVMLTEIQKIDSIHDFGGTRGGHLATDTITQNRDKTAFFYDQMRLFYIQKNSFSVKSVPAYLGIPPIKMENFSIFSHPGVGQVSRVVDDVENYCVLLAIKKNLEENYDVNKTHFKCIPYDGNKVLDFPTIKEEMSVFFSNLIDPNSTGKINCIVDTPGNFTKILKSDTSHDYFSYVLTQESAHDSAKGKPTSLEPTIVKNAYGDNCYCEVIDMPGTERTYSHPFFESNFDIHFSGMKYNSVGNKETLYTNVNYIDKIANQRTEIKCVLNALDHPTNVPHIKKEVGNLKDEKMKFTRAEFVDMMRGNDVTNFYNEIDRKDINYDARKQRLVDFYFTKKRAGDGLQAKIAERINRGIPLPCWKMRQSATMAAGLDTSEVFQITSLILVTIDRILFSYCVKNRIPVIYSQSKCFLLYNPGPIPQLQGGTNLLKHHKFIKPKNTNPHPYSHPYPQKGGNDYNGIISFFTEIPYCLFKLIPYILRNKGGLLDPRTNEYYWCNTLLSEIDSIPEDSLITNYDHTTNCLYFEQDPNHFDYENTENCIISLYGYYQVKIRGKYKFFDFYVYKPEGVLFLFTFTDVDIISTICNPDDIATRSMINNTRNNFLYELIIKYIPLEHNVADEYVGGSTPIKTAPAAKNKTRTKKTKKGLTEKTGALRINKFPVLNTYLDYYYNNDDLLKLTTITDSDEIIANNIIALTSYLNNFKYYVVSLCYDNDKYEEDFEDSKHTTKTELVLFFYYLVKDFKTQKDKIWYGFLEYFIKENKDYFIIADDLENQLHYIFCSHLSRPFMVHERIADYVANTDVASTDLFLQTQTYFDNLIDKIKSKKISTAFKNKYLSFYGFKNIMEDFCDLLKTNNSSSLKASSKTARTLNTVNSKPTENNKTRKNNTRFMSTLVDNGVEV